MTRFLHGDCLTVLKTLPAQSVNCIVTSPPYYNLRDYGVAGQIGLEETPEAYITKLVEVFREARRVLTDDGTIWLNLGDSYSTGTNGRDDSGDKGVFRGPGMPVQKVSRSTLPPKNLLLIPHRVALALQADGWIVRQDIVWKKDSCMPESVTDRCTKSHEYLFLIAKQPRYYYDHEAIKEPSAISAGTKVAKGSSERLATSGVSARPPKYWESTGMRNKRSVWTINPKPFPGSHFAVMPERLVEPCILAGTSEKGHCPKCGERWIRIVKKIRQFHHADGTTRSLYPEGSSGNRLCMVRNAARAGGEEYSSQTKTEGWKAQCDCGLDPVPDVVLDLFAGAGTTCLVAEKLGRTSIGIELNQDYITMAEERIAAWQATQPQYVDPSLIQFLIR